MFWGVCMYLCVCVNLRVCACVCVNLRAGAHVCEGKGNLGLHSADTIHLVILRQRLSLPESASKHQASTSQLPIIHAYAPMASGGGGGPFSLRVWLLVV